MGTASTGITVGRWRRRSISLMPSSQCSRVSPRSSSKALARRLVHKGKATVAAASRVVTAVDLPRGHRHYLQSTRERPPWHDPPPFAALILVQPLPYIIEASSQSTEKAEQHHTSGAVSRQRLAAIAAVREHTRGSVDCPRLLNAPSVASRHAPFSLPMTHRAQHR